MSKKTRKKILIAIGDHFQSVIQWRRNLDTQSLAWATKYLTQAEALIEFLEEDDCGSIGGFDAHQPRPQSLFQRWDWLYRKHHDPAGKRFGCDIVSYEDIKEYFSNER